MMNKKHITDLLPEYLDGILTKSQIKNIETHLKDCDSCKEELRQFQVLHTAFDSEKEVLPSEKLKSNFYEALELEKQKNPKVVVMDSQPQARKNAWMPNLLKLAASIALLIGGFALGKYQQEQKMNLEIATLQNESLGIKQMAMLSLMENKSASKRIQGVNYIDEFSAPDEAIVKALADRMLHDENANVRLSAVEALEKFTTSETVKKALIISLKTEKDPGIQIAVIQTLVKIQEKKAVAPMQELLEQEDTQPYVKKHIKTVLPSII
ncbi:hypothetical protein GGR42_002183 [Saonia flava]|uniref:Putative zinc-finger domain-containing protein n=1 Tax=Saonia flava TaxID=523696 RepID=A0A846QU26_9FLAO|nr:HEAT repeat domain-containing protein [Saonia flava]NJB71721.1 hypothetical protein [Saonia flava]